MSTFRLTVNTHAAPAATLYGPERSQAMSAAGFDAAVREVASWPGYAPTPLVPLPGLARKLGVGRLDYKDERGRFGLASFKALGGAYAVLRLLAREIEARGAGRDVSSGEILSGHHAAIVRGITVTCATDGNHGRSVAWGARLFGCRCVIYIHATVSEGRRAAIARYGAEVVRVPGNYDDSVRHAAEEARANGWFVVSDTSYPGYRDVPRDVMHGYGVMASEIVAACAHAPPPTHVFVQAGVGALAAAVCAYFWIHWQAARPRFVTVEPLRADCVYRSIEAGQPVVVHGELETIMAGLSCGEVSSLAWDILREGCNACIAIDDVWAVAAMRALAYPSDGDAPIVAGETGAAGLAALLALAEQPGARATLGLDAASRVLLLGSEGDTDPGIYQHLVGRTAAQVVAR
jgi:diaminopropionate ammonia-lyase